MRFLRWFMPHRCRFCNGICEFDYFCVWRCRRCGRPHYLTPKV